MTIDITYDREAGCFVGHAVERDILSAGTTWQRCIEATVEAVTLVDRWKALPFAERRARFKAAQ